MLQVLQMGWVHHPTYSVVRHHEPPSMFTPSFWTEPTVPTFAFELSDPISMLRHGTLTLLDTLQQQGVFLIRKAAPSLQLPRVAGSSPGLIWVVKKTMVLMSHTDRVVGPLPNGRLVGAQPPVPIHHLLVMANNHLIFSPLSTCLPLHGL